VPQQQQQQKQPHLLLMGASEQLAAFWGCFQQTANPAATAAATAALRLSFPLVKDMEVTCCLRASQLLNSALASFAAV
jgi:hypothetical protein